MYRYHLSTFPDQAMPPIGFGSQHSILSFNFASRSRSETYEKDRRDQSSKTLLWLEENMDRAAQRRLHRQHQKSASADANDGNSSYLPETESFKKEYRASSISLFAKRQGNRVAFGGLECRYHVYTDECGFWLFGRNHGLVQPFDLSMETFQFTGQFFLFGGARRGFGMGNPSNFQYRPGSAIHKQSFCRCNPEQGDTIQHGWKREGFR